DDVHLSAQGATKAANVWYSVVKTLLDPTAAVPVSGVSVSPATVSVTAGATATLTATVSPSNATNKNVSWTTSNAAVATVSTAGVVTGVAAGTATITVTTQDGSKTATTAVTVTAAGPPNLLTANPGFESGTGVQYANGVYNGITGWVLNNTAYNSIGVTAGGAYQGNNKLQLVYAGRAETAPANRAPVTAGQSYTLKLALAKTGNTNTSVQSPIAFRINWYNAAGTLLGSTGSGNLLGGATAAWAVYTVTGTAPANATRAGVFVELVNTPYPNQDAATFHVDDAVLTGGGPNVLKIYAAGRTNSETMQLKVNGAVLQTWTNVGGNAAAGTFAEYTYTTSGSLANAEVHFTNDAGTNDLRIDRVTVNGTVYQAENAQSFDAWGGSSCNPTGEWLYCNGYKKFTTIPAARAAANESALAEAGMRVYPVPVRGGTLHVAFADADTPYALRIADSQGVEVYRAGSVRKEVSLKVASWPSGVYFIKAVAGAQVITRKIVLVQ
ncbi:MAG: Ig-like domain-containing protein, partial [Cytophagales bacterium]|nr:Ig-like domain-containing protein [Cytophagales bacterium]